MITPFESNFRLETFLIDSEVLSNKYVILSNVPDLETINFILEDANDILSNDFSIIKIDSSNSHLYPEVEIGKYIITWNTELKNLLESGIYDSFQIRYLSI